MKGYDSLPVCTSEILTSLLQGLQKRRFQFNLHLLSLSYSEDEIWDVALVQSGNRRATFFTNVPTKPPNPLAELEIRHLYQRNETVQQCFLVQ